MIDFLKELPSGAWVVLGGLLPLIVTVLLEMWRTKRVREASIRDERKEAFDAVLEQWTAFANQAALLAGNLRSLRPTRARKDFSRLEAALVTLDQATARAEVYAANPEVFQRLSGGLRTAVRSVSDAFMEDNLNERAVKALTVNLTRIRQEGIAQIRKELGIPALAPSEELEGLGAQGSDDGGTTGSDPDEAL